MPLVPSPAENLLLLKFNAGPGPMLDLMSGAALRAAVMALRLGIFSELAPEPLTASITARRVATDPELTARLLDYLACAGYLTKRRDGRYELTRMTRKWLLRESPRYLGDFIQIWDGALHELWSGLDDNARSGKPGVHLHDWLDARPARWLLFNEAMRRMALAPAREMARRVPLPAGASRLLDVGGNHGLYAAEFCRRYPQLQATILDGAQASPAFALDTSVADRIHFLAGDVLEDYIGQGYDAVLLSNVLHYLNRDQCSLAIERIAHALRPGGRLIVSEQVLGRSVGSIMKCFTALLRLNYGAVLGGDIYDRTALTRWVEESGMAISGWLRMHSALGQTVLIAERTANP